MSWKTATASSSMAKTAGAIIEDAMLSCAHSVSLTSAQSRNPSSPSVVAVTTAAHDKAMIWAQNPKHQRYQAFVSSSKTAHDNTMIRLRMCLFMFVFSDIQCGQLGTDLEFIAETSHDCALYITLHYVTLHYITLRYVTCNCSMHAYCAYTRMVLSVKGLT